METSIQVRRTAEVTLTLPAELSDQIAKTAAALDASLDETVAVLLRYGLAVQLEKDREIARLAEQIASRRIDFRQVKLATWRDFPPALRSRLQLRLRQRRISASDLSKLAFWVANNPECPEGEWFKDFGSFILCGEGSCPKTFLDPGMTPYGIEL
jgi:hypothetical protein